MTALPNRPPTCSDSAKSTWSWTSSSRPVERPVATASCESEADDGREGLASGQTVRRADCELLDVEATLELVEVELPGDGGEVLLEALLLGSRPVLPVLVLADLELLLAE